MRGSSSQTELCSPEAPWTDEEELQELRVQPHQEVVKQAELQVCSEIRRLAHDSPSNFAAVLILLVLSITVLVIMVVRDLRRDWQECDSNTVMAKHFYCFNISAQPGVHLTL